MVSLTVPPRWLNRRRVGDVLCLRDIRGSTRRLVLEDKNETANGAVGFVVSARQTPYLGVGTVLQAQLVELRSKLVSSPRRS